MSNTTIQIKRTLSNAAPNTLAYGELAFAFGSNTLFIGDANNIVIPVSDTTTAETANAAYAQANAAYAASNALSGQVNTTFQTVNTNIQSANTNANNRVLKSGDTMTGTLVINTSGTGLVTGNVNVANTIMVGGDINFVDGTLLAGNSHYKLSGNTITTALDATPIIIDSFPASEYSTLKYLIQIQGAGGIIHATELLCIQDGTTAYFTEYATLVSGDILGYFEFRIETGNIVNLKFTPQNPALNLLTVKLVRYTIASA